MAQPTAAAPLVSIGDNVDVFFNGSSSVRWSSNIFRDEDDEVDDIIWSLTPGFEVNLGRGVTNADLSLITRYEIRRYADLDELDTELFNIQLNGSYRTSRLDLSGSAYFREQKSSTGDINLNNDLVESDRLGGRLNAEYRFSPKFSLGSGISYSETEYKDPYDANFSDRERFTVPVDIFYELTPKVDLSIGYSYGETDVSGRPAITTGPPFNFILVPAANPYTTEDHFFNIGARGNLLPKLTGFFKVGYRLRDTDRPGSSQRGTLGIDSDLTWATTPKLTNRIALSRDFGVSGEGVSSENTSVSLTSNYSLNSYFAASVFADYTLREYINVDREENQYRLGARLTYTPNQYWSFGAGYTYSENDSDAVNRTYEDHSVDFTASLRY
ncbi:outer membrane beta-barrel protein [Coraliomargarita sinensis]|uniref:outer membrane beta-barrel protein n=1 Tax=Coraliomargarita sinensis TaxID=2174842 RepID=UPI001E2FD61C|nr:outer membrane beta-barrel protein [Coraliomargarita sinensis]